MSEADKKQNPVEKPAVNEETIVPQEKAVQADEGSPSFDPNAEVVIEESPELEAARTQIAKLKDAFMRAKAEEDNVRRRSEKEIANGRKFAIEAFAKEMLNVHDSLKLACSVALADDVDESVKSIREGVELTLKQLDAAFAKFSLRLIIPEVGEKPDPNLHQAMTIMESQEVESGCIVNVIQPGFQLHDRLLRPALVVVAK